MYCEKCGGKIKHLTSYNYCPSCGNETPVKYDTDRPDGGRPGESQQEYFGK